MKSKVIFQNQHYTACHMRDGSLIVTHNRKQGGKRMAAGHPQLAEWLEALGQTLDAAEGNQLCRVFLQ